MNRVSLAFILVAFSAVPAWPGVEFNIGSMNIGDALTPEFAYQHCPAKDKGKPDIRCRKSLEIDSDEVFVSYQFDDFKLVGVELSFSPNLYDNLVAIYTQKFGTPTSQKEKKVATALNAEYTNQIAEWETTSGTFVLMKYGISISSGYAVLKSPEHQAYLEKKQSQKKKNLIDEL